MGRDALVPGGGGGRRAPVLTPLPVIDRVASPLMQPPCQPEPQARPHQRKLRLDLDFNLLRSLGGGRLVLSPLQEIARHLCKIHLRLFLVGLANEEAFRRIIDK
jgi:hypothetical protein